MSVVVNKIKDFQGFDANPKELFALFDEIGLAHTTYEHPPIFTVEEGVALNLHALIPGQHGKSLFLTNKDGGFWLVVAREETRVDLKALSERLGVKRFSFAKPEQMFAILGVTPGSATPFALMNDKERKVRVVVEENYIAAQECVFHPLRNTHSTVVSVKDLLRFMTHLGYEPTLLPLA